MFIRIVVSIVSVISLNFGLVSVGLSQTTPTVEITPAANKTSEEIIVYGEKSLIVVRNELYRAEESFFTLFNSLNSDDDFDIKCEKITVDAERRRHHVCRPKFVLKLEDEMVVKGIGPSNSTDWTALSGSEHAAYVKNQNRRMWAEMATLVKEHPELQKEMASLQKANRAMDAERQRR